MPGDSETWPSVARGRPGRASTTEAEGSNGVDMRNGEGDHEIAHVVLRKDNGDGDKSLKKSKDIANSASQHAQDGSSQVSAAIIMIEEGWLAGGF